MAQITYASADYIDSLPIFGAAIIIHLDNTQALFLSLEPKASDPAFNVLRDDKRLFAVKTDGSSIYWADGPRLTFDEIMGMLQEDGDGKEK